MPRRSCTTRLQLSAVRFARSLLDRQSLDAEAQLDAEDQERIDKLWAEEAERRNQEIEDGIVQAIPGEEVMNRLRSRYKR